MFKPNGYIFVATGSVCSGKSLELIRRVNRATYAKKNVLVFKPKVDNREDEDIVKSRFGIELKNVVSVANSSEISLIEFETRMNEKPADVIAIDEIQFFDANIVEVVKSLANHNIYVICCGLDMDYKGNAFSNTANILALCDECVKFKAICAKCGEESLYSNKITNKDSKDIIEVGYNLYEPLCRVCYNKENNKEENKEENKDSLSSTIDWMNDYKTNSEEETISEEETPH